MTKRTHAAAALTAMAFCSWACSGSTTSDSDSSDLGTGGQLSGTGGASSGSGGLSNGAGGSPSGGASTGTGGTSPVPTGPLVFGYVYDLSNVGNSPAALPMANVDVVVHAFVTADGSGNVVAVDGFESYRADLVQAAHNAGKKVVLSLGGSGSTWQMAQLIGTAAQATFVQNVANKVAEWGYDGVDFDFEFPGNNCTPAQFSDFLNQLRTAVKAKDPNNILMFGVSPGWWLESYEWSTLSSKADYAFYFCYDWNNPERGPMTKPGSSFTMQGGADIEASCRGALNYILSQGYPASQLVVGLPFAANGGAPYSGASAGVKSGTPDAASMEVSDGGGGWWPNAASMTMKVNAVLDPSASVLSGAATVAGVGFWQWGEENANSGADLSTAIRTRVDQLK